MEFKKTKSSYSIIGNFIPFLLKNESSIEAFISNYQVESKLGKMQDGTEVKSFIGKKGNVIIRLLPNRIDFDYIFASSNNTTEEAFQNACIFFSNLGERYGIRAARLALVTTLFTDNTNNEAVKVLANKMNANNLFGPCAEFSFRLNTLTNYFERINSVVNISAGSATNNQTKEVKPILLTTLDINTLASNREHRFDAIDLSNHFSDFLLEEQEKINVLNSL